ncbi:MAG: hypothetical protein ACFFCW_27105 [Candidatus Hodarchaeota archaeon]
MKELDFVDVSEFHLSFKLKKNLPFDPKKGTLVSYLEGLKEFDKRTSASPMNTVKNLGYIFILFLFGFFSVFFFSEALSNMLRVFQNTFYLENNYFALLGIPELFIAPVTIFSYLLAGSIMLVADIFFIAEKLVGVYKTWSSYHEQLFALTKKLHEMDLLEEFADYQKETNAFQLKRISISWEMEWLTPFIFKTFPPYFHEIGEVSLYMFALISFPLPILVSIITTNLFFLIVLASLVLFLGFMASLRIRDLIQVYRNFKNIQNKLIEHQQEKLLQLLFEEDTDPVLIHANQENLYRLTREKSIPTSFPLLPLSILLPIFSAIIGYVILAIENTPR